jgi:hypothetical protein
VSKKVFNKFERFAVYNCHDNKCYICRRPISYLEYEIDHVIPESLLDRPNELTAVLIRFGLPHSFDLNSFDNWLPACGPCNRTKSNKVFEPTIAIQEAIRKAKEVSHQAKTIVEQMPRKQHIEKALSIIECASPDEIPIELLKILFQQYVSNHPNLLALECEDTLTSGGKRLIVPLTPEIDVLVSASSISTRHRVPNNTTPSGNQTGKLPLHVTFLREDDEKRHFLKRNSIPAEIWNTLVNITQQVRDDFRRQASAANFVFREDTDDYGVYSCRSIGLRKADQSHISLSYAVLDGNNEPVEPKSPHRLLEHACTDSHFDPHAKRRIFETIPGTPSTRTQEWIQDDSRHTGIEGPRFLDHRNFLGSLSYWRFDSNGALSSTHSFDEDFNPKLIDRFDVARYLQLLYAFFGHVGAFIKYLNDSDSNKVALYGKISGIKGRELYFNRRLIFSHRDAIASEVSTLNSIEIYQVVSVTAVRDGLFNCIREFFRQTMQPFITNVGFDPYVWLSQVQLQTVFDEPIASDHFDPDQLATEQANVINRLDAMQFANWDLDMDRAIMTQKIDYTKNIRRSITRTLTPTDPTEPNTPQRPPPQV